MSNGYFYPALLAVLGKNYHLRQAYMSKYHCLFRWLYTRNYIGKKHLLSASRQLHAQMPIKSLLSKTNVMLNISTCSVDLLGSESFKLHISKSKIYGCLWKCVSAQGHLHVCVCTCAVWKTYAALSMSSFLFTCMIFEQGKVNVLHTIQGLGCRKRGYCSDLTPIEDVWRILKWKMWPCTIAQYKTCLQKERCKKAKTHFQHLGDTFIQRD